MECYCVARNKPIRREITKLQTATVITVKQHLKNFRNVDCVPANHNKGQDTQAKSITVAVCGLVISRLVGLFLATQ